MFFRSNALAFTWIVIVTPFFLIPGKNFGPLFFFGFIPADLLFHLGVSAVLSFLFAVGFRKQYTFGILRSHPVWWAAAYAFLYGIIIEVLQGTLPVGRTFDGTDLLANMAGCGSAGILSSVLNKVSG